MTVTSRFMIFTLTTAVDTYSTHAWHVIVNYTKTLYIILSLGTILMSHFMWTLILTQEKSVHVQQSIIMTSHRYTVTSAIDRHTVVLLPCTHWSQASTQSVLTRTNRNHNWCLSKHENMTTERQIISKTAVENFTICTKRFIMCQICIIFITVQCTYT